MSRSISDSPPRLWELLGPWPAVALALLCYANTLFNGFTYDDNAIVRTNTRIRSLANWRQIWLTDYWYEKADDEPIADPVRDRLYRPLTLHSFAVNYALQGENPAGYHAVNIVAHALVCWLVWLFALRLVGDAAVASLAGILFAIHPVHSEAVAGIVGRGEILAAGFVLLGLLGADAAFGAGRMEARTAGRPGIPRGTVLKGDGRLFPRGRADHPVCDESRAPARLRLVACATGDSLHPVVALFPATVLRTGRAPDPRETHQRASQPAHGSGLAGPSARPAYGARVTTRAC